MTVYILIMWFGVANITNSISIETKDHMTCENIAMQIKADTRSDSSRFASGPHEYYSHKCIKIEK